MAPRIVNEVSNVARTNHVTLSAWLVQALGKAQVSRFVAGAPFGEVQVLLFVAGAEVQVSLFVAGAALGDFLNASRGAKCCIFQ